MANNKGIITAPVNVVSDIPIVLGIGSYDVGTQCRSDKINIYSYKKPVNVDSYESVTMTEELYRNSLIPINYKIGSSIPTTFKYGYNKPVNYFRVGDFDGYNHSQYCALVDLANVISNVQPFDDIVHIPIVYADNPPLFQYVQPSIGSLWNNAVLLVCKKDNITRSFILGTTNFTIPCIFTLNSKFMYDAANSMGIKDYTCTAFVVAIPYNHVDKNDLIHEVTNTSNVYFVYPETMHMNKVYSPAKVNFKITNPAPRCYFTVSITQSGIEQIGEYIPENAIIGGSLSVFEPNGSGLDLWYEPNGITFAEWKMQSGNLQGGVIVNSYIIANGKYNKMAGSIYINYYNFGTTNNPIWVKPTITEKGANSIVTDNVSAKNISVSFTNLPIGIGNITNDLYVSFYYIDPDFRP